jgi:hypothetical protein
MNALAKNLWRLAYLAAPYRGQFVVVFLLAASSMALCALAQCFIEPKDMKKGSLE